MVGSVERDEMLAGKRWPFSSITTRLQPTKALRWASRAQTGTDGTYCSVFPSAVWAFQLPHLLAHAGPALTEERHPGRPCARSNDVRRVLQTGESGCLIAPVPRRGQR